MLERPAVYLDAVPSIQARVREKHLCKRIKLQVIQNHKTTSSYRELLKTYVQFVNLIRIEI